MQGNGSFRLIVRRGPQPNQIYELNKDVITLGRDITNDIVINDPEVSRHHCRLTRGGGGYTLEDLGSTNGTFVNGQRLMGARPLSGGDQVGLGETVTLSYESTVATAADFGARPTIASQVPPGQPQYPAQPSAYQPPTPYQQPGTPTYQPPAQTQIQQPPSYSPAPPAQYQPYQQQGQPYGYDQPIATTTGLGRWFFIGCGCVIVFCVVLTVAAALYIDANDLYCSVPIVRELVGIIRRCP